MLCIFKNTAGFVANGTFARFCKNTKSVACRLFAPLSKN